MEKYLINKAKLAKDASRTLSFMNTKTKNQALLNMAKGLEKNQNHIMEANKLDMNEGREKGLSKALLDRLLLNESRIQNMANGLIQVANLPDPVGETIKMWKRPNELKIGQVRVPIGVIGIIYESRPNVTADASALCLKSGNSVILRGGSEAINSNIAIADVLIDAGIKSGLPEGFLEIIDIPDRNIVQMMSKLNDYIDVLIPRGGAGLINAITKNATVPIIQTGLGNCHIYIDESADINMAIDIIANAKVQRPGVCNAVETVLIHKNIADKIIPKLIDKLNSFGVEIRGCKISQKYHNKIETATKEDWSNEYLDLILAIKVVNSIDEAIEHIYRYGTKHSEAIITNDYNNSQKFLTEVDAAAVYVNASTRFTDGDEFGFGAEIGISTQKLHARGPMGLNELTTIKYILYGNGQIRE